MPKQRAAGPPRLLPQPNLPLLLTLVLSALAFIASLPCPAHGAIEPWEERLRMGNSSSFHVTTTNADARRRVRIGMDLLHSYWYDLAAEVFHKAQESDPACVMAYVGEALTHKHALWKEMDVPKGRAALKGIDPAAAAHISPVEQALLQAAEAVFEESKSRVEQDRGFLAALEPALQLKSLDITAVYAFGMLGLYVDSSEDAREGEDALAAARTLLLDTLNTTAAAWEHPGILHATIHAFDFPGQAENALPAARRYSSVAPTASHALHMPSHTFYRLGLWSEGRTHNVRAYTALDEFCTSRGLSDMCLADGLHDRHWASHGDLQLGLHAHAKGLVSWMIDYVDTYGEEMHREGRMNEQHRLDDMLASYIYETRNYCDDALRYSWVACTPDATNKLRVRLLPKDVVWEATDFFGAGTYALRLLVTGIALLETWQPLKSTVAFPVETLEEIHAAMRRASDDLKNKDTRAQASVDMLITHLKGVTELFEYGSSQYISKAADMSLHTETYTLVIAPPAEVWAYMALRANDAEKAVKLFLKVEKRYPSRTLAVLGLARALALSGSCHQAEEQYARLREMISVYNSTEVTAFWATEVREFSVEACLVAPRPSTTVPPPSTRRHVTEKSKLANEESEEVNPAYPIYGFSSLVIFFVALAYLLRRQWHKHPPHAHTSPEVRYTHLDETPV